MVLEAAPATRCSCPCTVEDSKPRMSKASRTEQVLVLIRMFKDALEIAAHRSAVHPDAQSGWGPGLASTLLSSMRSIARGHPQKGSLRSPDGCEPRPATRKTAA